MRKLRNVAVLGLATGVAALGLAACGGGSSSSGGGQEGGTATVLMGTAPDYLDPQLGYTTQSAEATGSATRRSSPTGTRPARPAAS